MVSGISRGDQKKFILVLGLKISEGSCGCAIEFCGVSRTVVSNNKDNVFYHNFSSLQVFQQTCFWFCHIRHLHYPGCTAPFLDAQKLHSQSRWKANIYNSIIPVNLLQKIFIPET